MFYLLLEHLTIVIVDAVTIATMTTLFHSVYIDMRYHVTEMDRPFHILTPIK